LDCDRCSSIPRSRSYFSPVRCSYKVGSTILLSLVASRSCPMLLQGRAYEAEPKFPEPQIFAPLLLGTYGAVVRLLARLHGSQQSGEHRGIFEHFVC
jgi:hypothetical protein